MEQLTQQMKSGELNIIDVPQPIAQTQFVVVKNHYSVISAGTEKSKLDLGKKSLFQKAKARPDLVRKMIRKLKTEGFWKTYRTVNQKLTEDSPLGYSTAGIVESVGLHVEGIQPGDRVACGGAGYANHAEFIAVPKQLVAKIPDGVSFKEAAFTTIGSIALQGVRLANPLLGERFLVIGLGLVGQITAQLLKANGCDVLGYDPDVKKTVLLETQGMRALHQADQLSSVIAQWTQQVGVDGVLICAGTASNQPIEMAAECARSKARVVVVGAVGMNIPREPYFKKEISVVVSRSYGPGRYDPHYEENGIDYPIDYVRFTEQRNMQAFLQLLADKRIDMSPLITHEFTFAHAKEAYEIISSESKAHYLGIVLNYELAHHTQPSAQLQSKPMEPPHTSAQSHAQPQSKPMEALHASAREKKINLSVIGAGNYVSSQLLPLLKKDPRVQLQTLMTGTGRTTDSLQKQFGFIKCVGNTAECLNDHTNAVLIGTRHNTHAQLVCEALAKNKPVFVEKPLALSIEELEEIQKLINNNTQLMVGFNRRFSPLTTQLRAFFAGFERIPKVINIRANAGFIEATHWVHDVAIGGGRVIGEACHFVDLASFIATSKPVSVFAVGAGSDQSPMQNDNVIITIRFANGSIANITYTASGSARFPKEYIEVFSAGRVAVIDDFKQLTLCSDDINKKIKLPHQDKGQKIMLTQWLDALAAGKNCIPISELIASSLTTILAVHSMAEGIVMPLD